MTALADRYAELCRTPSDIVDHLPRFVELVRTLDAAHVIELGSRSGVSTVAWLYALEFTGGRLTSVDLDKRPIIPPSINRGVWSHVQGDDTDPDVIAKLDPADIVFIDTSHHYTHTVQELNLYRWLVKPGGVLCGHDFELPWPEGAPRVDGPFPVKRAVNQFVAENGYDLMSYPDSWGLFVLRGF